MARRRVPLIAVATLVVAVLVATVAVAARRPHSAEAEALATAAPTGQFEVRGSKFFDPDGVQFVPVGTNMNGPHSFFWSPTQGKAAQLKADWGFNFIRLVTCLPGGCHGPESPVNDDLDGIVAEYTAQRMVVMVDYHQLGFGATASPDDIATAIEFWTDIARRFKDNPYVWFNLFNEPEGGDGAAQRWRAQHQPVIDAIRATGATNIIVIDDTQAGQGAADWWNVGESPEADSGVLSEGPNLIDPVGRLAFDVHPYDVWGFPNGNDPTCATRYTDEQRDARFASYVQRVYDRGFPLLAGEFGFRADDSPTSGTSYHDYLPDSYPPCGSTNLLAAETAYRVAPRFDLGMVVWPGFALTTAGTENYDLEGDPPTNLTRLGQHQYDYSWFQAGRVPGTTVPPPTAPPTTEPPTATPTTEPPTTDPPTTEPPSPEPPTTAPSTTAPTTTAPPASTVPPQVTVPPPTTVPPGTVPPPASSTSTTAPPSTSTTVAPAPAGPLEGTPLAVLVVADPAAPTAGDLALSRRLRSRVGAEVVLVDDAAPEQAAALVVVIAPSADPTSLGAHYRDVAVPVLHLGAAGWDEHGLTSAEASALAGNRVSWEGPGRSGPGGAWRAPRGTYRALFGDGGLWGVDPGTLGPGATPLLAAARGRDAANAPLAEFAYPFAAVLANGACTPAKRVALGIADDAVGRLTSAGWATVDGALAWLIAH